MSPYNSGHLTDGRQETFLFSKMLCRDSPLKRYFGVVSLVGSILAKVGVIILVVSVAILMVGRRRQYRGLLLYVLCASAEAF